MNMDLSSSSGKVDSFISRTGVPKDQAQTFIQLYESIFVYNTLLTNSKNIGKTTDITATALLADPTIEIKG